MCFFPVYIWPYGTIHYSTKVRTRNNLRSGVIFTFLLRIHSTWHVCLIFISAPRQQFGSFWRFSQVAKFYNYTARVYIAKVALISSKNDLTYFVFSRSLRLFCLDKLKSRKRPEMKTFHIEFSSVFKNAHFFPPEKSKQFSRQYDRKFTPSYTILDVITCPGKCRNQSHSAYWQMRAKEFGNSIYQTHVSRFSVRNWTFETAFEFSLSHLFRFTISTVLSVRFSSSVFSGAFSFA